MVPHTKGSRDFYVHAYLGLLPRRAVDMLAVRIEQLTAEGLSPSKIRGLAGRSQAIQPHHRGYGSEDTTEERVLQGDESMVGAEPGA